MRFRHAVHLTSENFSSVFKLLLYRLFTAAVFGSLGYVILSLGLSAITGSAERRMSETAIRRGVSAIRRGSAR